MNATICFFDERIKTTFPALASSTEEDRRIHAHLNAAFDVIARDAFCGVQIPKRLIPKSYQATFGIDNLWKLNFHKSWRLMYSIASDGDHVIALIIEWLPIKSTSGGSGIEAACYVQSPAALSHTAALPPKTPTRQSRKRTHQAEMIQKNGSLLMVHPRTPGPNRQV